MVQLLLEQGATPIPPALAAAAFHGNVATVRLLLAAACMTNGLAASGGAAFQLRCMPGYDQSGQANLAPVQGRCPTRRARGARRFVQAILNALGAGGTPTPRTPSHALCSCELRFRKLFTEAMQLLIDRRRGCPCQGSGGIDGPATTPDAWGRESIIRVLTKAGASTTASAEPVPVLVTTNNTRACRRTSIPLLQRTGIEFYKKGAASPVITTCSPR